MIEPKSAFFQVQIDVCLFIPRNRVSRRLYSEQALRICHEWIDRYVYQDQLHGGELHRHLHYQKPRRKRYGRYECRGRMPDIRSTDKRPAIVETRTRLGD